jgi:hypothetical protein
MQPTPSGSPEPPIATPLIVAPGAKPDGVRRLWVSIDESGIDSPNDYHGFGTLWMPDQRRGNFSTLIKAVREKHNFQTEGEFKWTKVTRQKLDFYKDIVAAFFKTSFLAFHCIVVRKSFIDLKRFDGDMEAARLAHLHTLLTYKLGVCMSKSPGREHKFKVWCDKLPSSYAKEDEKLHIVANHALVKVAGQRAIESVDTKDSKEAPSIQLCDLLLGAVMDAWNHPPTGGNVSGRSEARAELSRYIASFLGWEDLRAGTYEFARKLNIWYLQDPNDREVYARPVNLVCPLPDTIKGAL